jgi:cytochrome c oxidase subunit IV
MEQTEVKLHPISTSGSGAAVRPQSFSFLVDYFHVQGYLRWTLIIVFMLLKAGLIVAIFMHMAWERLALKLAILVPPLCLLVLIGLMAIEGDYTFLTRGISFLK